MKYSLFVTLFLFAGLGAFSQVSRQDSLQDFDVSKVALEAHLRNFDATDTKLFVKQRESLFLAKKFNLVQTTSSAPAAKYGSNSIANAPCLNEGFEGLPTGPISSVSGWTASTGNMFSPSVLCTNSPLFVLNNAAAAVMATPIVDALCNNVPTSPFGGTNVLKVNQAFAMNNKVAQTFSVTGTNFIYQYAYKAYSNSFSHLCCEASSVQFNFYNCSGTLITAMSKTISPNSLTCYPTPSTWSVSSLNAGYTPDWVLTTENLSAYIGSCITVEVVASNCSAGSHAAYCYYDAKCADVALMANNNLVTTPSYTSCPSTATLAGVPGFSSYLWQGPALSGVAGSTNPLVTTTTPGNYTLTVSIGTLVVTQTVNLIINNVQGVAIAGSNSVCAGNTVSLQAQGTGLVSYTWTPASNSQTMTFSPSTTTIVEVSATGSLGCISADSKTISVQPAALLSLISQTQTICRGQTIDLLAGTNIAASYLWNTGSATSSITVSPILTTAYTVTALTPAGCVSSASLLLTVIPLPTLQISAGGATLCAGQTINLTANSSAASSFLWNNSATTQNIAVSPTLGTVYSVTVTNNSGCSSSAMIALTVYALPQVQLTTSALTVCASQQVSISVNAAGMVGSVWSNGTTNPNFTVVATQNAVYSVTVTDAQGCSAMASQAITIKPSPQIQISASQSSVCPGQSAVLSANGSAFVTYQWHDGSVLSSTSVFPLVPTQYSVVATGNNGCSTTALKTIYVLLCTGIQNVGNELYAGIRVFPNPTTDSFVISGTKKESGIIINELGQMIREFKLDEQNGFSLSIGDLAAGVYFVKTGLHVVKVVVK